VAARFVAFILSKPGQEILSRFGHRKLEKIQVEAEDLVPEIIRRQLSS
jgi:ABC-type Fe3+ transport system substrate-binding protein